MVPVLTYLKFDYGPMASAEKAAVEANLPEDAGALAEESKARPILVWLPLLVLGVTLFATLNHHGFPFEQVAGSDFRAGLSAAYFLAAVTIVLLMVYTGVRTLLETFSHYIEGMTGMMPIAATLVLGLDAGNGKRGAWHRPLRCRSGTRRLAGWFVAGDHVSARRRHFFLDRIFLGHDHHHDAAGSASRNRDRRPNAGGDRSRPFRRTIRRPFVAGVGNNHPVVDRCRDNAPGTFQNAATLRNDQWRDRIRRISGGRIPGVRLDRGGPHWRASFIAVAGEEHDGLTRGVFVAFVSGTLNQPHRPAFPSRNHESTDRPVTCKAGRRNERHHGSVPVRSRSLSCCSCRTGIWRLSLPNVSALVRRPVFRDFR